MALKLQHSPAVVHICLIVCFGGCMGRLAQEELRGWPNVTNNVQMRKCAL